MARLTYTGTAEDDDREWRLIQAREDHMKTLTRESRAAVNNARTTCTACGQDTPVAVRCHSCGDWLNNAAHPDLDVAKKAVVDHDVHVAAGI